MTSTGRPIVPGSGAPPTHPSEATWEQTARPPVELVIGPSGSGKTAMAIASLLENIERAVLVVTSAAQAEWIAARAAETAGLPVEELAPRVMPLAAVVADVLRQDRAPGSAPISREFQRLILTELVPEAIAPSDFFGRMLNAPGFVAALMERLREWKVTAVTPADFAEASRRAALEGLPQFARKLGDLERLFGAYEGFLHANGLRDEEDSLRVAAERLARHESSAPRNASLVMVDGFYRFTRAQRDLIRALALSLRTPDGQPGVMVTLPADPTRPVLFATSDRSRALFAQEFDVTERALKPVSRLQYARPEPLERVSARLFRTSTVSAEDAGGPPEGAKADRASDRSVLQIIDAPNPYVEAELVAREFRRTHESRRLPWREFAVVLRSYGDYGPILSAVFERYDIPLRSGGPERFADNPLLRTVSLLLRVCRDGWRRDDVLGFLRSSYTAPDLLTVDNLRRLSWARAVREGRDEWLALARRADDGAGPGRATLTATLEEMARTSEILTAGPMEIRAYVAHVREIVLRFGLEERIAAGETARAKQDADSLGQALGLLDLLARVAQIREEGPVSLAEFCRRAFDAWETGAGFSSGEHDAVSVLEPHASRERAIRVCAVMGLTERVFPRRISEDPFLRDEERNLLTEWRVADLEEQRLRADDERYLFYLAVTAPTDMLLLSFPRSSHENDALPSFFLDEVRALFPNRAAAPARSEIDIASVWDGQSARNTDGSDEAVSLTTVVRTLADVAPRAGESVSAADRLLAACGELFDPQGAPDLLRGTMERGALALERLRADAHMAQAVRSVLSARRLPRLPRLLSEDLRRDFAQADRVFTASELESYARCPFQYLLRHVWRLQPESEGLDPRRQSALLHTVLRRYFRKRAADAPAGGTEEPADLHQKLRGVLGSCLKEARLNTSPHRLRILNRRLDDDLMGFAAREARFTPHFGLTPSHFHLSYGREAVAVTPDALSCAEPLVITAVGGTRAVAIGGIIDRMDLDESGRRAMVVEYETGKPPEFDAIRRGESLQMPLHLLAVERLFGLAAAGAIYDSMQETGRRRFHRAEHVAVKRFGPVPPYDDPANVKPLSRDQYVSMMQATEATVLRLAESIEQARIEAVPGYHCRFCEFRDVCRTSVLDGHDGEPRALIG